MLPVDGKVFEVAAVRWRAELANEPGVDDAGLCIDYEIRFAAEGHTMCELTLSTSLLTLQVVAKEFYWDRIERWLADPKREREIYWGESCSSFLRDLTTLRIDFSRPSTIGG